MQRKRLAAAVGAEVLADPEEVREVVGAAEAAVDYLAAALPFETCLDELVQEVMDHPVAQADTVPTADPTVDTARPVARQVTLRPAEVSAVVILRLAAVTDMVPAVEVTAEVMEAAMEVSVRAIQAIQRTKQVTPRLLTTPATLIIPVTRTIPATLAIQATLMAVSQWGLSIKDMLTRVMG